MVSAFSLYRVSTGEFTGDRLVCDEDRLAINPAPEGFAWIPGAHAPTTARVILITDDHGTQVPTVAAQTPTQPPETAWVSWAWDDAALAWREVPKLQLLQLNARQPLIDRLAELDTKVARPVGEISLAQALGQTPPAAAVQRLQAIANDKQALRDRMAAIAAATTREALQQLLDQPLTLQLPPTS